MVEQGIIWMGGALFHLMFKWLFSRNGILRVNNHQPHTRGFDSQVADMNKATCYRKEDTMTFGHYQPNIIYFWSAIDLKLTFGV